jgi:hypothetical protein
MTRRKRPSRSAAGRFQGLAPIVRLRVERLESRALPAVVIAVNAALDQHAINPFIYGTAFATTAQLADLNSPYNRSGGNAETEYNWQINATNHASDWYFESIAGSGSAPSGDADQFVSSTRAGGAQPTLTIPTIGWVAKLGPNRSTLGAYPQGTFAGQTGYDPYWSSTDPNRPGNGVLSSGQITTNDPNIASQPSSPATEQAWIQHLVSTFGAANSGGVRYYTLDNEPSIWFQTQRDVHPNGASEAEVEQDIVNYAAMIKSVDPNAQIVGPEEWGWTGYFDSGKDQQYGNTTGDWGHLPDKTANGGMDYLPWVLNQLHTYDQAHGTKSLDVFSVHYYPQGAEFSNDVSQPTELLRNQSTRSLWDPTYVDQSWIGTSGQPDGGIVKLIPRLKNWVNTYYPGLKTDVSEYNWGAEGNMNGATTQADIFGIFGREGLDMANRWTTPATNSPTYLAMKMYRNYDGSDHTFGQTNVRATVPNPDQVSAFASLRADGALTVMVVNKNLYSSANPGATTPITLNLSSFAHGAAAQLWQLAATNAAQTTGAISHLSDVNFSADSMSFNAPMESVSLLVIPPAATAVSLTSSANPAAVAIPVTFTATVSAGSFTPTGTVTFMDGNTVLGTATLNAGIVAYTTSALAAGTHSITAVYGGATGFAGSTSAAVTQVVAVPTTISAVQVNGGAAQRSEVRSIAVTFSDAVTFSGGNAAAAFQLTHVQDGIAINNLAATVATNGLGQTVVTLTFTTAGNAATEIDPISAQNGGAASLADGRFQLAINSGLVTGRAGLALDGDANGSAGGNYVSPTDTLGGGAGQLHLYRLFGDATGDGVVDQQDLGLFRGAFNNGIGDPFYLAFLDANNDGVIDQQDLGQFRSRFNLNIY